MNKDAQDPGQDYFFARERARRYSEKADACRSGKFAMLSTFIQAGRPPDFCLEEQICLYIGVENISTYFASSTCIATKKLRG